MVNFPLIAEASTIVASIAHFGHSVTRERRIAGAIAPALIGDLNVVSLALEDVKHHALKLEQRRITQHDEIERALRSVARIRLSAFDRFNNMLPFLGKDSAHIVIECYTTIVRTVTLIREDLESKPATHELKEALIIMATDAEHLSKQVDKAQAHLRKYAS